MKELRCQDGRVRQESDVQNTRCKPEQGLMTEWCVQAIWLAICSDQSLVWCLFSAVLLMPDSGSWDVELNDIVVGTEGNGTS